MRNPVPKRNSVPQKPMFDDVTFEFDLDLDRLKTLLERVKAIMWRGQWMTLTEIQKLSGGTEASVSARLRDLRKPKFGGQVIDRQRRGDPKAGLWEYRLTGDVVDPHCAGDRVKLDKQDLKNLGLIAGLIRHDTDWVNQSHSLEKAIKVLSR